MGALSYIFRPLIAGSSQAQVRLVPSLIKLGAYLGGLYGVAKTGLLSSPDDVVNGGHKTVLFLHDLVEGRPVGEASLEFRDSTYNARSAGERGFAGLGGWREPLRSLTAGLMIFVGVRTTWHEYGQWFQTPPAGTAAYQTFVAKYGERMPARRLIPSLSCLLFLYLGARLFADSWGNSRGRKPVPGTCTSNPQNFEGRDFNLNIFSSEWAMMTFLATAHARAATLAGNATDVLYHALGRWVHRRPGSLPQRLLGQDLVSTSSFTSVRPEVLRAAKALRVGAAGAAGAPGGWKLLFGGLAVGAMVLGAWSVNTLAKKESCNPAREKFFVSVGGLASVLAGFVLFHRPSRRIFDATCATANLIFRAPRLAHLMLFTLVGATTATTINFVLRWTQGFRRLDYYVQQAARSFYGPMPNRVFAGIWSALTDAPLGRIEFVMPGQLLFYQTVEILTQPKETLVHKYRELAQAYRYASTPARAEEYGKRLRRKKEGLRLVLRERGVSTTEIEEYYRRKKANDPAADKLPIRGKLESDSLADNYYRLLEIEEEYRLAP